MKCAAAMIKEAKKPYIFVGGGVIASEASEELKRFVKKVDAPVCDTLMGKGAFDGSDPHIQVCLVCTELRLLTSVCQSVTFL